MTNYSLIAQLGLDPKQPFSPQLEKLGWKDLGENYKAVGEELYGSTSGFHLYVDVEAKSFFCTHSGD